MSSESELKVKRGQIKASLTRFKKFIDPIDYSDVNDEVTMQIQLRLEKFEPIFDEFDKIQVQIEATGDEELENQERDEFETTYYDCLVKAKKYIKMSLTQNVDNIPVGGVRSPSVASVVSGADDLGFQSAGNYNNAGEAVDLQSSIQEIKFPLFVCRHIMAILANGWSSEMLTRH